MKFANRIAVTAVLSAAFFVLEGVVWAETAQLGKIDFLADTNVRMFHFSGQVETLQSQVERTGNKLSKLELRIPVNQLSSGIEIRDKHMRERVFTANDGTTPDIVYTATQSDCKPGSSKSEEICQVAGQLSFRGETHPQPIELKLTNEKHAEGSVKIDVKTWGVTDQQLSYTAIKVDPVVNVDFSVSLQ